MKLPDADIPPPDVTLRIHCEELALNTSTQFEDALRTYARTWTMDTDGYLVITVAGYIYRDHIAPLLRKP